jgi:hypothetical protein
MGFSQPLSVVHKTARQSQRFPSGHLQRVQGFHTLRGSEGHEGGGSREIALGLPQRREPRQGGELAVSPGPILPDYEIGRVIDQLVVFLGLHAFPFDPLPA